MPDNAHAAKLQAQRAMLTTLMIAAIERANELTDDPGEPATDGGYQHVHDLAAHYARLPRGAFLADVRTLLRAEPNRSHSAR